MSHFSNILHGHSLNYTDAKVTAYQDDSNLKVHKNEPEPDAAAGTFADAVGAIGTVVGGKAGILLGVESFGMSYKNDPSRQNFILGVLELIPFEGPAISITGLSKDAFDYGINNRPQDCKKSVIQTLLYSCGANFRRKMMAAKQLASGHPARFIATLKTRNS